MILDTENTLYLAMDPTNGEIRVLLPRRLAKEIDIHELWIDDPESDPLRNTDAAEFKLLQPQMDETRIDWP